MTLTISSLLSRVRAASGPDRELDAVIVRRLGLLKCSQSKHGYFYFNFAGKEYSTIDEYESEDTRDGWPSPRGSFDFAWLAERMHLPEITASIDDAVALVERVLPWSWRVGNTPSGRGFCYLGTSLVEHDAATPPLAILAALLSALEQKESAG